MNLCGKKILILAGAAVHVKVVEAARRLGVRTIVSDYLPIARSPAKGLADESWDIDACDVPRLVERCRAERIDGVLDFCIDPVQRSARQVAELLGLPNFGTRPQVLALTDKTLFKRACRDAGVDTVPSYTETDVERGTVDYPVIIKPGASRGSRGVRRCLGRAEALAAIRAARQESSASTVVIERCMLPESSQDLTISYLVRDGEPFLVSVGDRHSGRREDNLDRQLACTIQPSRYAAHFLADTDARLKRLIRQIGIVNGPVFFQGFYDNGKVRLYDPGLRFPGNEYERILARATGVDVMQILVGYCVTGRMDFMGMPVEGCWNLAGKACLQYMVNVGPGRIGHFEGLEAIARHPDVVDVRQKRFVGDVVEPTGDVRHRVGEVSVLCRRSVGDMKSALDFIHDKLSVRDVDGRSLLISPFGTETVDRWYGEGYESL